MKNWYVLIDNEKMGPYSTDVLVKLADSNQIQPGTLIWTEGLADWSSASEVPELSGHGSIKKLRLKSPSGAPPYSNQTQDNSSYHAVKNPLVEGYNNRIQFNTPSPGDDRLSVGHWMLTLFLSSIPFVGFILFLVWALSGDTPIAKKNWAKATLWWSLILVGLYVIFGLLAAIALPSFQKAREASQEKVCINNIRMIEGSKDQWSIEQNKQTGSFVSESDIIPYFRDGILPECPAGGSYILGRVLVQRK